MISASAMGSFSSLPTPGMQVAARFSERANQEATGNGTPAG